MRKHSKEERASRIDMLADLFAFGRDILDYKMLTGLHLEWFQALLENQFLLLLAPRGHLKSTVATTCYTLWRLVKNRNLRILIIAETQGIARKLLDGIKQHIMLNECFRNLFGAWDTNAAKWTEDSISVPRSRVVKEPSITCGGVLGNLVSLHNDLIILDDTVSNGNSYTPGQREKLMDWFTSVILPALEPDGQLCLVGTRWHQQDMYGHILNSAGFGHWKKIVLKAEWRDDEGNHHILFPERFSVEKLKQMREMMGIASYSLQMMNDISPAESEFKVEWLRASRYDKRPEDMNVYFGVDLAAGSKESHSRFGYVVIGIPRGEKDAYVLDARREHIEFPEQVKTIKRLCRIWRPTLVSIENNAYQASLLQVLRVDDETARLPIRGITTTGDKQRRIRSLAVLFENGAIRLPQSLPDLEEELLNFPRGRDDLLDALYLSLQAANEMRVEPRIVFTDDDSFWNPYPDGTELYDCRHCGAVNKASFEICKLCRKPLRKTG